MRKKILINNDWLFTKLPDGTMEQLPNEVSSFEKVNIPHTWYKDDDQYNGVTLYEKVITLNKSDDKDYYIEFNAADRYAKVYFNGEFIGEHKGGYSTFRFEIPQKIIQDVNKLSVLLDNRSLNEISPLTGDFTVYGGIYRDVYLIEVEKAHFDLNFYGSKGVIARTYVDSDNHGILSLEPHVVAEDGNAQVKYELFDKDNHIVATQYSSTDETSKIEVEKPVLWDGKVNPYLYNIKASLVLDGAIVDEVELRIGFKKIKLDSSNGFFLNDKHLKLNGVAKHQDDEQHYCATTEAEWKRDMECIKEIGANAVRFSHYQHPQGAYDLCDEEGFVAWAEIPMLKMLDTNESYENAVSQLKELIYQNIHHASICFWGFQNEIAIFGEESFMYDQCEKLNQIVKELDPYRISSVANLFSVKNESKLNEISDAVGYNIYFGWYYGTMLDNESFVEKFHKDRPNVPLGITEYGVDCNLAFHQENPKVKDYSEEYQALYHETVYPIFKSKDYIWGTFVWNMFDFGSARRNEGGVKYRNSKGLVCYDHALKKDAFYYYKAQWSNEPFVYIAKRRFVKRSSQNIEIKVYSNQEEVSIIVNDTKYTKQSNSGVFIFDNITLEMGENKVKAFSNDLVDEVVFIRQNEPEASYNYVDENPEINVRNWFLDEQAANKLSVMSPASDIVQSEEAMKVLDNWNKKVADALRARSGGMPLHRILNYMRKELGLTEESVQVLNEELLKLSK